MTDDPPKDLTDSEKLNRILAELADLKSWRAKVDASQEDRTKETRPKLDLIIKELFDAREEIKGVVTRLDSSESRLKTMALDVVAVRAAQRRMSERVSDLERRPN